MIPNTNDGSAGAPRLRCYLNLMALEDLPFASQDSDAVMASIKDAGYEGVQFIEAVTKQQLAACENLGLGRCSLGRVNAPADAGELAARFRAEGQECATLHVGWGTEDNEEAARMIGAVLEASAKHGIPLYVETHRATIFQDMWRTVYFTDRFPELRFNGDFSHWYTGQEMVYGGFENKLAFIEPVLERVRFMHGRIGDPGSMQVKIDGSESFVDHFREMWSAVFGHFLRSGQSGDYILFVPELLSPRIYYGRRLPDGSEEADRWAQSLLLRDIAVECFHHAVSRATS